MRARSISSLLIGAVLLAAAGCGLTSWRSDWAGLRVAVLGIGVTGFSVADTLDAITSDRPYRKASSFTAARDEIQRCAGTQFDPKVVEVYFNLPDSLWTDLRAEISQHARFSPFSFNGNIETKEAS